MRRGDADPSGTPPARDDPFAQRRGIAAGGRERFGLGADKTDPDRRALGLRNRRPCDLDLAKVRPAGDPFDLSATLTLLLTEGAITDLNCEEPAP